MLLPFILQSMYLMCTSTGLPIKCGDRVFSFAKTEHLLSHISVFCSLLARMLMLTHFFILVETRHNKLSDYFYLAKSDTGSFFYKLIVAEQKKSAIFNFLNANYLASLWSTRNCLHFDQWISDNHANSDLKVIHLWYCYNPILFILLLVCSIQYF